MATAFFLTILRVCSYLKKCLSGVIRYLSVVFTNPINDCTEECVNYSKILLKLPHWDNLVTNGTNIDDIWKEGEMSSWKRGVGTANPIKG